MDHNVPQPGSSINIGMEPDEFDYEMISMEMREARSMSRLRDIGQRIGKDETISAAVKGRLRELYGRLAGYLLGT